MKLELSEDEALRIAQLKRALAEQKALDRLVQSNRIRLELSKINNQKLDKK